jgi:DNA-binding winged helix-turn-helix (wHTH) protein
VHLVKIIAMTSTEHYIIKSDIPITFYPNKNKLVVGINDIRLEPLQTHLLLYFIHHRLQLVNTQQIASEVWQRSHVSDNLVRQVISALRSHLQDKARPYKIIQTIPKQGYLFEVDIELINEGECVDVNVDPGCIVVSSQQVSVVPADWKEISFKTYRNISTMIFLFFIAVGIFIMTGYFQKHIDDSVVKTNKVVPVYINDITAETNKEDIAARNVYNYLYYSINSDRYLAGYQLAHLSSANRSSLSKNGFELKGWIKEERGDYKLRILLENKVSAKNIIINKTFNQDNFFRSIGDVVVEINSIISPSRSGYELASSRITSVDNYNDWKVISQGISIFYRGEGGETFYNIASQLQRMKAQGRENYLINSLLSYAASLKYLNTGGESNRKLSLQLAKRAFEMSPRCDISNLTLGLALILNQRFEEAYPYLIYATENATSPLGFFLLSVADMHSGDPQEAEQHYKRFLQTQKENTGQLFKLISYPQKYAFK